MKPATSQRSSFTPRPVHLARAAEGQPKRISGYGSVFYDQNDPGTEYQLGAFGSYVVAEHIMPGTFDRALREKQDVRCLLNHDPNLILGRTTSGTLRLSADKVGLKYECDPPDTQYARDLLACLARNDISGASFSFGIVTYSTVETKLPDGRTKEIIEIRDVNLLDVSVVVYPAYTSATSEVRHKGIRGDRSYRRAMAAYAAYVEREAARLNSPAPTSPRVLTVNPALSGERARNARGKLARARLLDLD